MKFNIEAKVDTKVEIDYDNALNDAAWVLLDKVSEHQHVNGPLFNNMKSCLKAAIEKYLEVVLKENIK